VTGSGYLVETATACVFIDFGMFQGGRPAAARNRELAPVNPPVLDAVVATHPLLDHTGRLSLPPPHGFRGPVLATPTTVDVTRLILADPARLQRADAARQSCRLLRVRREPFWPLYGPPCVKVLAPLHCCPTPGSPLTPSTS
jgi:metallo-beta-lactamase family protein